MSNAIPASSERAIYDWVGPRNLQLGRNYLESDTIIDPRRQGNTVSAWCQGSMPQPYRLRATLVPEGIDDAHCSCPVGGGGRCKHVGVLLLACLERPDAFRVVEELDTTLERCSKTELIALIKRMLQFEPELETLLDEALSEANRRSAPVDPEIYRRQVFSAFRRGGDDWMASQRVARDIGVTLGAGDRFLALADYTGAGIVFRAVALGILEHHDEMMADEDGQLANVVDRCVEGLGKCLAGAEGDAAFRESCLQTLFDVYRSGVDFGGISLGEAAPDLILEHATDEEKGNIASRVRAAIPPGESWSDGYRRRCYGHFLLDLEMAQLDDTSFLGICRECGLLSELVDRLLTLGQLEDAVAEADSAGDYELLTLADVFREHGYARMVEPLLVKRIETSRNNRLAEWLKERYRERGDLAEALALAGRMIERRPHVAAYLEVRELSQALGVWQESRPQLLDRWSAAGEYALLTDIYLEEGEVDLALRLANRIKPRIQLDVDRLIRVAQAASETRPQAALDIYRQQAENLIEARGRDNYRQACVYLASARDLYLQLRQASEWTDFIAGLRERHRRLPALKEELDNAGL